MKNLKLELFNFKKGLNFDRSEIAYIIEGHMNFSDNEEKNVISSLNGKLKPFMYDSGVKSLLEGLNDDYIQYELLYELKNLYNVINSKNQGEVYRHPLNVLLQTINLETDQDRMSKILNELAVYDWVPEIRLFVHNLTDSPEQKTNLLSGGRVEPVYTIVEQVEEGHLAFIQDSWFLLSEGTIEKTLLEAHVKDDNKLRTLRTLETALQFCNVSESRIDFRISEYLTIGIGVEKKGLFINEDELNGESTLESVFSSPVIPIVNKNFYPIILEVSNNMGSFVELDVVKRVSNLINPTLEVFAFNFKDNIFLYRCDERYGHSFFKYDSAIELVNEVKNELNCDLTYFFEDKMGKETMSRRRLEDKEREITLKLEDVNFNISKIKGSIQLIGGTNVLNSALRNLQKRKENLDSEILAIKEVKFQEVTRF